MFERFENCESVFVEKTGAKDFSRFTPAIVRKPDDLVFPPFTTDYFEKDGSLEKLPIWPERGNPTNVEVGDILRLFGENYLRGNGVSREQGKVASRLSACRTHVLGGHVEQCDSCGYLRNAYNSCRNRHCPKCQGMAKEKWVEARKAELLPCGYFHEVFTLPHLLNPLILCNRKLLLDLLFETVSAVLSEFAADPRWRLNGSIGFVAVLHTWSQTLLDHFHLHCVVPGGALSFDGERWTPANEKYLFSSKALAKRFKKRFIDALVAMYENGELEFFGKAESTGSKKGFRALVRKLWQKEWVVYSKAPFGGPEAVLEYIGRYTHRVAISNNRIVSLKDGKVTFTYRDRQDNNELKEMTLDVDEFIRRFLLHVLFCLCYRDDSPKSDISGSCPIV